MPAFFVYRSGRTYGVYMQPGSNGDGQELVEGGFFTRAAAQLACDRWNREANRGA